MDKQEKEAFDALSNQVQQLETKVSELHYQLNPPRTFATFKKCEGKDCIRQAPKDAPFCKACVRDNKRKRDFYNKLDLYDEFF